MLHSEAFVWVSDEGAYRMVEHTTEEGEVAGVPVTVVTATYGAHVVWVDEAPGDRLDGTGHFELWDGEGEYAPIRSVDG